MEIFEEDEDLLSTGRHLTPSLPPPHIRRGHHLRIDGGDAGRNLASPPRPPFPPSPHRGRHSTDLNSTVRGQRYLGYR